MYNTSLVSRGVCPCYHIHHPYNIIDKYIRSIHTFIVLSDDMMKGEELDCYEERGEYEKSSLSKEIIITRAFCSTN